MGDRTHVYINLSTKAYKLHKETIDELFCPEEVTPSKKEGWIKLCCTEMNYGGTGELNELVELDIPFVGMHGAGGGYLACVFAYAGYDEHNEDYGLCTALCDYDGNILSYWDKRDSTEVLNYLSAYQRVMELGANEEGYIGKNDRKCPNCGQIIRDR